MLSPEANAQLVQLSCEPQPSIMWHRARNAVGAVILSSALAQSVLSSPAAAEADGAWEADRPKVTVAFDGDSMSDDGKDGAGGKYYDNKPGSPRRVWLGYVEDKLDLTVINASGQGSSGWLARGNPNPTTKNPEKFKCRGTNFLMRLKQPEIRNAFRIADFAVLPLGFNDTGYCYKNGKERPSTMEQVSSAVNEGMDAMLDLRTAAGKAPESVYVFTPCAEEAKTVRRERIIAIVREAALDHGFTWVNMDDVLNRRNTLSDHIHPDYEDGTKDLARAFMRRSGIVKEVRALRSSRS